VTLTRHAGAFWSRVAAEPAASLWVRLAIPPCDGPRDVDRLVRQVWFWRGMCACLLIGILGVGALLKALAPAPGQRQQIRIIWETKAAAAAAPDETRQ
jgi:hypothetical protein